MKMLVISFLGLCVGMLQCQSAPDKFLGNCLRSRVLVGSFGEVKGVTPAPHLYKDSVEVIFPAVID